MDDLALQNYEYESFEAPIMQRASSQVAMGSSYRSSSALQRSVSQHDFHQPMSSSDISSTFLGSPSPATSPPVTVTPGHSYMDNAFHARGQGPRYSVFAAGPTEAGKMQARHAPLVVDPYYLTSPPVLPSLSANRPPSSPCSDLSPSASSYPYRYQLPEPNSHWATQQSPSIDPTLLSSAPLSRSVSQSSNYSELDAHPRVVTPPYQHRRDTVAPTTSHLTPGLSWAGYRDPEPMTQPSFRGNTLNLSIVPPTAAFPGASKSGPNMSPHGLKQSPVEFDESDCWSGDSDGAPRTARHIDKTWLSGTARSGTARPSAGHLEPRTSCSRSLRTSTRIAVKGRALYQEEDDEGSDMDVAEVLPSDPDDDEEFRPTKRPRGRAPRNTNREARQRRPAHSSPLHPLTLWELCQAYPTLTVDLPLFYYALDTDLTMNIEAVPTIGSIPAECSQVDKADALKWYYHRGRRAIAQLDSFTARCDAKYAGSLSKLPELSLEARAAIRNVRRKIVERCENYKYTRRDILDKALGKGNWGVIEEGMVEWQQGGDPDPANDLFNVQFVPLSPPPGIRSELQLPPLAVRSPRTPRPTRSMPLVKRSAPIKTPSSANSLPQYWVTTPTTFPFEDQDMTNSGS